MADQVVQLPVDGTGKKVDASEVAVGANQVLRQRITIASDTDPAGLAPVSAANGLAVDPTRGPPAVMVGAAASIAPLNTDLLTGNVSGWFDASRFQSCSIQIVGSAGITAGAVVFEQTNDIAAALNGNFWGVYENGIVAPVTAAFTILTATTRYFFAPVTARYVRLRVSTAFAGANVKAIARFSVHPHVKTYNTVYQPTAASLQTTSTLAAGTLLVGDTGIQYRPSATGAALTSKVISAATTNATLIKAAAGRVLGWTLHNMAATPRYVKLFNKATAPIPGTDVPIRIIPIPAGGYAQHNYEGGIGGFALGIGYAIVAGSADLDATAVAAGDVIGAIEYA